MGSKLLELEKLLGDQSFLSATNYTSGQIIFGLLITFVFSLFIYFIYKRSYSGVVFSNNFGLSLIVVSLVSAMIVMAISGNLALSLGMVGALSIVRFRSAIKDPRDIAFLFWSVANGVVLGVFIYKLAIVSNILIGLIILFFSKRVVSSNTFLLIISGHNIDREKLMKTVNKNCTHIKLRLENCHQNSEEIHIEVRPKKEKDVFGCGVLIEEINRDVGGVQKVNAVSEEGI